MLAYRGWIETILAPCWISPLFDQPHAYRGDVQQIDGLAHCLWVLSLPAGGVWPAKGDLLGLEGSATIFKNKEMQDVKTERYLFRAKASLMGYHLVNSSHI